MNLWTKIIYKELEFLFHVECLKLITTYNIFSPYSIDELVGPPYIVILAPPLCAVLLWWICGRLQRNLRYIYY
jgi:hypothetical protein